MQLSSTLYLIDRNLSRRNRKALLILKISHYQMKLIDKSKIYVAIPGRKKGNVTFVTFPLFYKSLPSYTIDVK